MFYSFRVCIHPLARGAAVGNDVDVHGRKVQSLQISPAAARVPHAVTFDRCAEMLATLPRMFIEPDGSFVWTGEQAGRAWQIDGVLYDQGERLAYAEVSGLAPADEFDQLLAALGWPAAPLMFQLMPTGVFVSEAEFRRVSAA
jgi:hypothetical protein